MSNQDNQWEIVAQGYDPEPLSPQFTRYHDHSTLDRIPVPGGWLYRQTWRYDRKTVTTSITFVPKTNQPT